MSLKLCEVRDYTVHLVVEAVKIGLAAEAFKLLKNAVEPKDMLPNDKAFGFALCVRTPIVEELIFRGAILTTFKLGQHAWNKYHNRQLTPVDEKTQKMYRICITAALFGLVHLTNGVSIRIITAGLRGIVYGRLAEHYNSTVPAMAMHFTQNFAEYCIFLNVISPVAGTITMIFLRVSQVYIGKNDGDVVKAAFALKRDVTWLCVTGVHIGTDLINTTFVNKFGFFPGL